MAQPQLNAPNLDPDTQSAIERYVRAQPTFTTTVSGKVPSPTTVAGKFLKDDGTWATIAGGGSVTNVSGVAANGVSFSITNPTTTPAITITLGAITPTTVAATGAVTGTNLSGTNTGDQTITLTSDVTGSGTGSFVTTIAAGVVTLAKMANMATASLIYRKTAGTGVPEVNTLARSRPTSG